MVFPLYDRNPTRRTPWLTLVLVAANIVVYVFVQPTFENFRVLAPPEERAASEQAFFYQWAHVPCEVATGEPITLREVQELVCIDDGGRVEPVFPEKNAWLAVPLSLFLHGSVLHLLFNVWFLWIFGNNVEDTLGIPRYAILYFVGGLAASATQQISDFHSVFPVIGASGAIAAVMGAYLVQFPRARIWTLVFFVPLPVPAWLMLGAWFVLQFTVPLGSGIAVVAHVGGFIAGVVLMLLLRIGRPSTRDQEVQPAGWPAGG